MMAGVQKPKIQWVISLLLVIPYFSGLSAQGQYGGGSGEPNDPYLIYTAEQMNAIGVDANDWDKHFKLMADIDLSSYTGTDFNIIGYYVKWNSPDNKPFRGVFDGNGKIISNFSYTSTNASYVGLFGYVGTWGKEALIKDLGLIDPNVDAGTESYIGSLVGVLQKGTVTNCYVEGGRVVGGDSVGGLVGAYGEEMREYADPAFTISNCYSTSSVQGTMRVGGLVGSNYEGLITNCYAMGSVSGKGSVGGLAGQNGSPGGGWIMRPPIPGTILNCYSTGLVSGESNVGGLVGLHVEGTIIGCFWDIQTSTQTTSDGGTGKTTTEMKTADTFIGWGGCGSEGTWTIDEGNDYPRLWWETKPGKLLEGQLSDFLQGAGTEGDPYLIYNCKQFNMIGRFPCEWGKHFKLMDDIELGGYAGTSFNLIGYDQHYPFTGVLDGNGHTISNFIYDCNGVNYIGLFRYVSGENALIKDLRIINPNINAGKGDYVGSLAGYLSNGTIIGCHVDGGTVIGDHIVGGLVGSNDYGLIATCYATGSITGFWGVGGLVGKNSFYKDWPDPGWASWGSGRIENCYAACSVTGTQYVGGLLGDNERDGTIHNCYSVSKVGGENNMGGLAGANDGGMVTESFWDIQTSGQTTSAGGTGKTTAEMQTTSTFLEAGWDFVGETENGTEDIWWSLEGQDYPRLWWENWAFSAYPPDGAFDVTQPLSLSWYPGLNAMHHDIYFGEDEQAVGNARTESPGIYQGRQVAEMTTYEPGPLEWGKTYYWRVDEYNTDATISKGNVWSFTTADFIVIDDFEDYNDYPPDEIFSTWIANWTAQANGAQVGHSDPPFAETNIVHGGRQSMPFYYENDFKYSKATMTLVSARDWTKEGVGILSLWFYGDTTNAAERMYVNLNGIATVYHDNPDAALIEEWTQWTIDLQDFAAQGGNLTNANTIWIGFGDKNNLGPGGSGLVFFDDIRLYRPRPLLALSPNPQDGATDVIQSPILHWVPAEPTLQHDIHLGEDKELVANATTESSGIYRGRQVAEMTTYDPGPLEWGKTYYWRIDGVNEADPNSPWTGNVWSFTTANFLVVDDFEDYNDYPPDEIFSTWIDGWDNPTNGWLLGLPFPWLRPIAVRSGQQSMPFLYDNSGTALYSEATRTFSPTQDWTEEGVGVLSLWFYGDAANAAERMYAALNGGVAVYCDNPDALLIEDWTEWTIDLQEFAAQGVNLANVNTISIGFGDKNNIKAGGSGVVFFDDIRLYRPRPFSAFSPDPQDGATDVIQSPILHWVPAEPTLQHDIYFGEGKELVANATIESPGIYRGRQLAEMTTYNPGPLEWGKTYYWRIDEVSEADPNSPWKGDVWSFTTADFILIDDFEDYNDYEPDRIFDTWIDGWGISTNGAEVGYRYWPGLKNFVETTLVHGGSQSMPYFYDNNISYSEATMTLVWPRDWTYDGVGVLSLWFYGDPSNAAERMYVAIANANGVTGTVLHDDPDSAQIDEWTEWRIDLQEFAAQGVNLRNVNTISIGFGWMSMEGGEGLVLFDDIRLYRPAPKPEP